MQSSSVISREPTLVGNRSYWFHEFLSGMEVRDPRRQQLIRAERDYVKDHYARLRQEEDRLLGCMVGFDFHDADEI
jgi:hypothetical protein